MIESSKRGGINLVPRLGSWGAATYHIVNHHLLNSFVALATLHRHIEIARAFNGKAW
jgi:hypothetical protein